MELWPFYQAPPSAVNDSFKDAVGNTVVVVVVIDQ